jgi:hypothetical protein
MIRLAVHVGVDVVDLMASAAGCQSLAQAVVEPGEQE